MKRTLILPSLLLVLAFALLTVNSVLGQTTEFTYQGKLTDTGPPSPTYDFEFRLCDSAAADCSAPLAVQQVSGVQVFGGVFTVKLNFTATVFEGSDRWLEIAVKRPAQVGYTTLSGRQKITSAPYAIRSLNAAYAANSGLFGGLTIDDFVQNTMTQQSGNFNLSGDGTLGGTLLANRIGINVAALQAGVNLELSGNAVFRTATGNINLGTPGGEAGMTIINTNRADIRFDNSTLKLLAGTGTGAMASTSGININTLGNVGIGTTSPSTKLDVAGSVVTSGSLSVSSGVNVSNGLSVNSGNLNVNNAAIIGGSLSAGNGAIITGDASVSGKITTNSLRVNSGGFSFATIAGNYTQDICRDITFGTLGQCGTSLRRYKSAIETFAGGLNIINRLRPVSFVWKESGQRDVGFIAEEVFEIEPLLTTADETGNLQGVKYKQMSIVFVNAIKEQQAQIERQQALLGAQQKQISELKKLVCAQNPQAEICQEQ